MTWNRLTRLCQILLPLCFTASSLALPTVLNGSSYLDGGVDIITYNDLNRTEWNVLDQKTPYRAQVPPSKSFGSFTVPVLTASNCSSANGTAAELACLKALDGVGLARLSAHSAYPSLDDTYLDQPSLVLKSKGYASEVAVLSGTNRDEAAILLPSYPRNGTDIFDWFGRGFGSPALGNLSALLKSGAFQYNENPTPAEIFNVSVRITTDLGFRCLEYAADISAARHGSFKSIHTFMFNRTYSASSFTSTQCSAPPTSSRPYGDPDQEYFKCHTGEKLLVWGNVIRAGLPARDNLDLPFMQVVVDYWAAFGWTRDPNPNPAILRVRGFWNTLAQIDAAGPWNPVEAANPKYKLLQWNGGELPFDERLQLLSPQTYDSYYE